MFFYKKKKSLKGSPELSMSKLDNKLWGIFSKYIRIRDANDNGIVICCTCGTPAYWNQGIDAGHFIQRNRLHTKYDEHNVWGQCARCNRFDSGRQFVMGQHIDKKCGPGTAAGLLLKSQMRGKLGRMWYEMMIVEYREKLKKLAKEKGIEI